MRNKETLARSLRIAIGTAGAMLLVGAPAWAQTYHVNTPSDSVDAVIGDGLCADAAGFCSLRAAVQEANAQGGAVIRLGLGTHTLSIAGASEDLAATGDLDIQSGSKIQVIGSGSDRIDAAGLDRIFDVQAGASLRVRRTDLTGGSPPATQSGGAIQSAGDLIVDFATLSNNTVSGAGASGGAIFNAGGNTTVRDSTLQSNSAERAGGAIEANAGATKILRSTLHANSTGPSPGNGGGFHLTGAGTVRVINSIVASNSAANEGGGLWNSASGSMIVRVTQIHGNTASGDPLDAGGGGVHNDGGVLAMSVVTIDGNSADGLAGSGGGVLNVSGGTVTIANSTISNNSAQRAGGGVEANGANTTLWNTDLLGNTTGAAPGNGGGLHLTGTADIHVVGGEVSGNTAASEGGGLWNSAGGTMFVRNTTLNDNTASGALADNGGGALFNDGGTLTVRNASMDGNAADGAAGSGGAILNDGGTLSVALSTLSSNTASRAGGAIEAVAGSTTLFRSMLFSNETGPAPGNGGAFHVTGAGLVTIDDSDIRRNDAANEGGGVWCSNTADMTVANTTLSLNTSPVGPNAFADGPASTGTCSINGVVLAPESGI